MAEELIEKNLVHFKTESKFQEKKEQLKDTAIAFVKESLKIYTHETEYQAVPDGGTEGQVLVRNKDGKLVWQDNTIIRNGENGPIISDIIVYDDGNDSEDDGFLLKSTADGLYQPIGEYLTDEDLSDYIKDGDVVKKVENAGFAKKSDLPIFDDFNISNSSNGINIKLPILDDYASEKDDSPTGIIPKASASSNGVMTSEQYSKLESLPSEAYSKDEVDAELANKQDGLTAGTGIEIENNVISVTLDTSIFKIVTALPLKPETGDEKKIHLVLNKTNAEGNKYDEFLFTEDGWELLGVSKVDVDLEDYAKSEEVEDSIEESWSWGEY